MATSRALAESGRRAGAEEQAVLARWSSWGAIPAVFDPAREDWADQRAQLRDLLDDTAWDAARRTTINAHFTDAGIARAMWDAVSDLGVTGGRVLEPGCGAGVFIGLAPEGTRMVGVELDPTTAGITRQLYPNASIRTESFADTRLPEGGFDAVVGNVPFSDVTLYDPVHNRGRHSMHNHFIIKALALTRPGGVVAVLSSAFTMDAADPAARREISAAADLVGAVRLPTGAHRRAAGTEALTDVLILRRREPGAQPRDTSWESVAEVVVDGHPVRVNSYFVDRPERVLGDLHVGQGMYGDATLSVRAEDLAAVPRRLRAQLHDVVREARSLQLTAATAVESVVDRAGASLGDDLGAAVNEPDVDVVAADLWDGTIVPAPGGGFQVASGGGLEDLRVPRTQQAELRAMVTLRDGARGLLEAEAAAAEDGPELTARRDQLRGNYERYVARYGPLNRYSLRRTGRFAPVLDPVTGTPEIDPRTGRPVPGEELMARVTPPAMVLFKQDPHSALVRALETFDEATQVGEPAGLLRHRVIVPRTVTTTAETAADALAICLDQIGGVQLDRIAALLGVDEATARAQLGDLVYDDPAGAGLIHAPEYLSSDVRVKLAAAEAAAVDDPRFEGNVNALRAVLPEPIGPDEIEARLGSVWISAEVHRAFLAEILDDPSVKVENPLPGTWEVRGRRDTVRAISEWGTDRRPATEIAAALMEQRAIEVTDEIEDAEGNKRRVLNPVATTAAQEKADALQERFSDWVWEDPQRAAELADVYNAKFNSLVLRDYTAAGEHLTFPGLAATIRLRPHQRAAVARMVSEPAAGLFHEVGAGKTLEMVAGCMELTRMGLVSKPCVVVPNHMLEQFTREWLQAYPQARILAASSADLTKDRRRLFVARAAANDWDAVLLTQGAFAKIGVSQEYQSQYIERELGQLREALDAARGADSISVKRIEGRVLATEERYKRSLDLPRDPGITFEATGIDYLVVDEAHLYKNLATPSHIRDAAIDGSKRSADLHMKLEFLRERHGERVGSGARVATMATATPLANSITEAYVMQRYLRPDLLAAAGVTSFDGWAATFGSVVTEMEMGPAGGFRLKSRFARFQNVPEMLRMWQVFADVKTAEDLNLPVPAIAPRPSDGVRDVETVVLQPTPELSEYIAEIAKRADRVANREVHASDDNMLLISTDGRKAALDLRLVDERAVQTGPVKLDAVADRILAGWRATRHNTYLDPETGEASPVRGGSQLVFCDLGTPKVDRWDAYTEIRGRLIEGGMPAKSVRFIHEARNDAEKARLFSATRAGHVAALIGSTEMMGVGTNVQTRVTALHHIDCPWRPADIQQRDGRAIRQGNLNPEVGLFRYVVERSFDGYSWQTVARKAKFIAQVMRGRLDSREIEDIGDVALSAAEAKALASGNPLVLERATAEADFQKLRRQQVAHTRGQSDLRRRVEHAEKAIVSLTAMRASLVQAQGRTQDVAGDAFRMTVDAATYDNRADAAAAVAWWANSHRAHLSNAKLGPIVLGEIAGHVVLATPKPPSLMDPHRPLVELELQDVPRSASTGTAADLLNPGIGLIRAIENKTTGIARSINRVDDEIAQARRTRADAQRNLKSFPRERELGEARDRLAAVDAAISEQATSSADDSKDRPEPAIAAAVAASFPATPNAQDHPRVAASASRASTERTRHREQPAIER